MADETQWPLVHVLKKPITIASKTTGETIETVTELKLREPAAGDVIRFGNPVDIDMNVDPPKVEIVWSKMGAMIGALASLPQTTIDRMAPRDLTSVGWMLAGFFIPEA